MSLNDTVSAERPHIAFFGMRNAGKSSLVNAVTGQQLAVVSDVKGTTTDPVRKAMELLPIGPVVIIDTPGLDDEGELGELRVQKAREILAKTQRRGSACWIRSCWGSLRSGASPTARRIIRLICWANAGNLVRIRFT